MRGVETRRSEFEDFQGAAIAHRIEVLKDGTEEFTIHVTNVSQAGTVNESAFDLPGHEWNRAFTDEVR